MKKNKTRKAYFFVICLSVFVVICGFFMPDIKILFSSTQSSYSYESERTSFEISRNVTYSFSLTENNLSETDVSNPKITMDEEDVKKVAQNFFNSISDWKYGCDFSYIGSKPYLNSSEKEMNVVWLVECESQTLKSKVYLAIGDTPGDVIGFYIYNFSTEELLSYDMFRQVINDNYYYLNKYIYDVATYYKWSNWYSNVNKINKYEFYYQVGFVDSFGEHGYIDIYYNAITNNVSFNMKDELLDFFERYTAYEEVIIN